MTIRNTTIVDLVPSGTEKVLGNLISLGITPGNEFATAGVLASSPFVSEQANAGPRKFSIPFLNNLDTTVFNVSGDDLNVAGDVHNITADEFDCIKLVLNNGWGDADLARMVTGVDALAEISAKISAYWGAVTKTLTLAVYGGVKTKVKQVSGTALGVAMFADAQASVDVGLDTLIVNPLDKAAMIKADENAYIPASKTDLKMDQFGDYKVVTSRSMPVGEAALFGAGAFAYAEGAPAVATEVERVANGASGGGGNILHDRRNFIIHPQGADYVGTKFVPTNAADAVTMLSTATNWSFKLPTTQVPMVHLTVTSGS